MTAYYPSQGSAYGGAPQPLVYGASGYQPTQYAQPGAYYGQQEPGMLVVPTHGSHHSHHSHHSHRSHGHGHGHHHSHSNPTVITTAGAPMVMQPTYGHGGYGHQHYHLSFGERFRRFFGLAPRGPFKYRNNKGSWGFMGYSRRQRYSDAATGAEVDRKGRPIYRV